MIRRPAKTHGPTPAVGPGDLAVPREGDRTTWTVHGTLRKAYVVDLGGGRW